MVAGSPRSAKTRGQQATMVEDERASVRKRPKSAKAAAKRVRFADEFGVELPPFSEEVPGPAAESPGGAERSGPLSPRAGRCSPPPPTRGDSPPPGGAGCDGGRMAGACYVRSVRRVSLSPPSSLSREKCREKCSVISARGARERGK